MARNDPGQGFLMPWEHYVCSNCFWDNPYAIWLIKQKCFHPYKHRNGEQTLVAVDPECMMLAEIRPLPPHYMQFKGDGRTYQFAHSEIEVNTWNIKKRMIIGT